MDLHTPDAGYLQNLVRAKIREQPPSAKAWPFPAPASSPHEEVTPQILTEATPYESVLARYELPFPLYEFQQGTVNRRAAAPRSGLYYVQGTGKTVTATAIALYKFAAGQAKRALIAMPPILLTQWYRFLTSIPGVSVVLYRGTPKERKALRPGQADFTLCGIQIFKRDYERLSQAFGDATLLVVDEASSVKNVASENYKKVRDFSADKQLLLLTGTPLSTPEDAYAYINLISPGVYRNKAQFMNLHAGETDFFGNIVTWKNLDVLQKNFMLNAERVLIEDVIDELPAVSYIPVFYDLAPAHMALYKKLVEEQLLVLENGGKIDATSQQALQHALGQIICNYDHFAGDDSKVAACFDLVEQTFAEMGPHEKLVIFAVYRMTNRKLLARLQKYGAVAAFGDQTVRQNQASVDRFVNDPSCRAFIGQPSAVGYGVDRLQEVCNRALFLEIPPVTQFHQAVSRLYRAGQRRNVQIRIGTANGTLQVRRQRNLLEADALVNKVIRNVQDLREALYGG